MKPKNTKPYEPTSRERAAIEAYAARRSKLRPLPRLKFIKKAEGSSDVSLDFDHPDWPTSWQLLKLALGAASGDFTKGLVNQLVNVVSRGKEPDEAGMNFMLSMLMGVEPKDQVEAMLAAQMAAVHSATMTSARRLAHAENIEQQDSAERAFNKLTRTFVSQMDALKRYRSEGQQQIIVKHVTVNADQAVVTDTVVAGKAAASIATHTVLLTNANEKPMQEVNKTEKRDLVGIGGGTETK